MYVLYVRIHIYMYVKAKFCEHENYSLLKKYFTFEKQKY